jgi:MerR, DNA binding
MTCAGWPGCWNSRCVLISQEQNLVWDARLRRTYSVWIASALFAWMIIIRDLLAVRDTGICPCEPAEQHLRHRLTELDAEMAPLAALRTEMVRMLDALPTAHCPPPAPGTWCPPTERG